MQQFWKNHALLRVLLITVCFLVGLALVIGGWKMTGQLKGLGVMCLGVLSVLAALAIYNAPFED